MWVEVNRQRLQQCHLEHGLSSCAKRGQKLVDEGATVPSFLIAPKVVGSSEETTTTSAPIDRNILQSVLRKADADLTIDDAAILLKALV
jgi:hypothetical protein